MGKTVLPIRPTSEESEHSAEQVAEQAMRDAAAFVLATLRAAPTMAASWSTKLYTEAGKHRYKEDIQHRSVIVSWRVDFQALSGLGVGDLFEAAGLQGLCILGGSYSERIVKMFYANADVSSPELSIRTFINGCELTLTPSGLNDMLGCASDEAMDKYFNVVKDPAFGHADCRVLKGCYQSALQSSQIVMRIVKY